MVRALLIIAAPRALRQADVCGPLTKDALLLVKRFGARSLVEHYVVYNVQCSAVARKAPSAHSLDPVAGRLVCFGSKVGGNLKDSLSQGFDS